MECPCPDKGIPYRFLNSSILFAGRPGLDIGRFRNDIQQKPLIDKVEKDFKSGFRSGVNRTPTFFINGEKFDGEWRDNHLLQYLKTILTGVPSL